jgi:hypothetical protein
MKTQVISTSYTFNDKNKICIKLLDKKDYTFLDFIKVGFGLSIRNRYADWFFGHNNVSYCVIDKKNYINCLNGDMMDCIKFMSLLEKCDYKI